MLITSTSYFTFAYADINADKSVYSKGDIVTIFGTLELQETDMVNILEIIITDEKNNLIKNEFTPLNDDNTFVKSFSTRDWNEGKYTATITYGEGESIEFEIRSINDTYDDSKIANLPDKPINLRASVLSSTEIMLSWSAPDDESITGYKIEYRVNTDPNYIELVTNTGNTDTSYSHSGLTSNTVYSYRVSTINPIGVSEPSSSVTIKTTNDIISESHPVELSSVPTNVKAKAVSSTSVELSWNPPTQTYGQTIQDYTIQKEIASNVYAEIGTTSNTTTKYIISDLSPDTTHTFVVIANYALGSSDISKQATVFLTSSSNNNDLFITPDDIPDSPTNLDVIPISSTEIDLYWDAPDDDDYNNAAITGYKIEVRTTSSSSYEVLEDDIDSIDTMYSHTNLLPDTTYTYRVSAVNNIGTSEPSDENSVKTLLSDNEQHENTNSQNDNPNSPSAPNSPVNLKAIPISQSRIDLSWSPPVNVGNSSLLGYKIESKTNNESDYSILITNTGTVTSYSHTGLTIGTTYQYRIYTITSFGQSNPSEMVEATTDLTNNQIGSKESSAFHPVNITLSTNKDTYESNDLIEISGIISGSTQDMPLGLRILSSNDAVVYARSISIDASNTFETTISPIQRQSLIWQNNDEFIIEVTHNGRIQATSIFEIHNENTNNTSEKYNSAVSPETELNMPQSLSSDDMSTDILSPDTSNRVLDALNNQNLALQSANQQLLDENNQLKIQIEELNKRIEQLDIIVKEQIRVMMETLNSLRSND